MTLKDYYKILGVDAKVRSGQLDSKFNEHVNRIKHILDKEKAIKDYIEIFEAYFILRQEEPKVVYEECLDRIKDKDSKEYLDYEKSLKKRFNNIILKANSKAKRNFKNIEKNKDWQIILEMIIESVVGIISQEGSISILGLIVFLFAVIFPFVTDLNNMQYLIGFIGLLSSFWIFRARFRYLKREELLD